MVARVSRNWLFAALFLLVASLLALASLSSYHWMLLRLPFSPGSHATQLLRTWSASLLPQALVPTVSASNNQFSTRSESFSAPPVSSIATSTPRTSASVSTTTEATHTSTAMSAENNQNNENSKASSFPLQPALFVSHGSPTVVLQPRSPGHQFLHRLGASLLTASVHEHEGQADNQQQQVAVDEPDQKDNDSNDKNNNNNDNNAEAQQPNKKPALEPLRTPSGIVVLSAHWTTYGPTGLRVAGGDEIIYDFGGGFPRNLFDFDYDHGHAVKGSPKLASAVLGLLNAGSAQEASKVLKGLRKDGFSGLAADDEDAAGEEAVQAATWKSLSAQAANRGWDHGVWTVLGLIFPSLRDPYPNPPACCQELAARQAAHQRSVGDKKRPPIPVAQVSIPLDRDPEWLVNELGARLAWLRRENIAIVGSGAAIHNLGDLDWNAGLPAGVLLLARGGGDFWQVLFDHAAAQARAQAGWANSFADWLKREVAAGNTQAVAGFMRQAPNQSGRASHPTDEHFRPLLIAMGAGASPWNAKEDKANGKDPRKIVGLQLHDGFEFGNLGMHAFAFPAGEFHKKQFAGSKQ